MDDLIIYEQDTEIAKVSETIRKYKPVKYKIPEVPLNNLKIKVEDGLYFRKGRGLKQDFFGITHPIVREEDKITLLPALDVDDYKNGYASVLMLDDLNVLNGKKLGREENGREVNRIYDEARSALEQKFGEDSFHHNFKDTLTYLIERKENGNKLLDSVTVTYHINSLAKIVRFPMLHEILG